MKSKQIETLSVNAVRDSIVMSEFLDQYIPDNDKEPTWDGAVYIYNSDNHTNSNLIGRMPVQVKGKECSDIVSDEISYSIKVSNLNNFLNDGGAIFFVVLLANSGSSKRIYYIELTPIKIRIILSRLNKPSAKTTTVKLQTFPDDNNKKATIFMNCYQNCHKQSSFSDVDLLSLEELEEKGLLESISIPFSGVGNSDPQMAIIKNEVYLYAQIKDSPIQQPLAFIPEHIHTRAEISADVCIKGKNTLIK